MIKNFEFEGDNVPVDKLPKPVGWRVLVGMLKVETTTAGGIVLTEETRKMSEYLRSVAKVLAIGPSCYKDPKFQGGIPLETKDPEPWVKVGDIVHIGQYAGQKVVLDGSDGNPQTLKLLNDDEILAVVPDLNLLSL